MIRAVPGSPVWDAASGKETRRYTGHAAEISALVWSPEGKELAFASRGTTIPVWNLE
jgi:WD40 repeat protein